MGSEAGRGENVHVARFEFVGAGHVSLDLQLRELDLRRLEHDGLLAHPSLHHLQGVGLLVPRARLETQAVWVSGGFGHRGSRAEQAPAVPASALGPAHSRACVTGVELGDGNIGDGTLAEPAPAISPGGGVGGDGGRGAGRGTGCGAGCGAGCGLRGRSLLILPEVPARHLQLKMHLLQSRRDRISWCLETISSLTRPV